MATTTLKLKPFDVPEFVLLDMPAGRKQDGGTALPRIYLSDLDDAALEALISEFAESVMMMARTK